MESDDEQGMNNDDDKLNDLNIFSENIKDDPYIYSINLLDSNLDIDLDLSQIEILNEPGVLPSIYPTEQSITSNETCKVSDSSSVGLNNLVFKTPDPIKKTQKRTKYAVTTPPFVASCSQKKKNVCQLDTWKIITTKC